MSNFHVLIKYIRMNSFDDHLLLLDDYTHTFGGNLFTISHTPLENFGMASKTNIRFINNIRAFSDAKYCRNLQRGFQIKKTHREENFLANQKSGNKINNLRKIPESAALNQAGGCLLSYLKCCLFITVYNEFYIQKFRVLIFYEWMELMDFFYEDNCHSLPI